MTTFAIGGQGSGDFRETSGRVQLLHVVTRNAQGNLTPDSFTQTNPPIVPVTGKSTTLATITKVGVLGSSIAFTRPDFGNGYHGGPVAGYPLGCQPLGVFLNDAIGNAFENTPGIASGKGPYVCGNGSTLAVSIYETKKIITAVTGTTITYNPGDKLYASANGFVTNLSTDAYEFQAASTPAPVVLGIVKVAPDANSSLLVFDLRI
jgi:hypothetical protein